MAVLLMRLSAPLQAWGSCSKFNIRTTEREPTKSGVIGMIAAALGIQRCESQDKLKILSSLKFGVRVDKEGKLLKDFHMVHADKDVYLTERYYLSDATFLVALESDNIELLDKISNAIQNPVYPLFLGRRSCPPTLPIFWGVRDGCLVDVLKAEPSICQDDNSKNSIKRLVYDVDNNGTFVQDVPVSFSQMYRLYDYRYKYEEILTTNNEHDPMAEL